MKPLSLNLIQIKHLKNTAILNLISDAKPPSTMHANTVKISTCFPFLL